MKQRNSFVFLVFSLVLVVGLVQMLGFFRDYFGDANDLRDEKRALQSSVERERLKTDLVRHQLWDFQQDVAEILPTHGLQVKNHDDYRLSELAETVRVPASVDDSALSTMMMEHGRDEFRHKNFSQAAAVFRDVIRKYPTSTQVVEAHFLLGESLFQLGRSDECLDTVFEMVNQFPGNEMTGYMLLRNAQILQSRKRNEEAGEVFRLIGQQFANHPALRDQARRLASENE